MSYLSLIKGKMRRRFGISEWASFLDHVAIVLVEPQVPGNIGATARAMRNIGLSKLVLVNPVDFLNVPEARWMAHMSEDLLENARMCATLDDALQDAVFVVGTTSPAR